MLSTEGSIFVCCIQVGAKLDCLVAVGDGQVILLCCDVSNGSIWIALGPVGIKLETCAEDRLRTLKAEVPLDESKSKILICSD